MPTLKNLAVVTLVSLLACTGLARAQDGRRAFLLVVDDLHLDFRSTPRTRELIRKVLNLLRRDGDSVAIVSTGQSSVAVPPTSNVARLTSGLSHVSGEGLKVDQIIDPEKAEERLNRARIAIATARGAIRVVASRVTGPVVVLYFSGGYAEQSAATDLAELASDAYRANATIYAFDPRLVGPPWSQASAENNPALESYYREARDSLHSLAESTGGRLVSTPGELDGALAQIAHRRGG
jgi:hypothetical protein